MKIPFGKYHGCGNDFIITKKEYIPDASEADFARKVCDRHTGIGADGMILVKEDPLEMIYYNQDGSRAPMCGNGIRCFSQYCLDEKITTDSTFPVQTLAGEKIVTVKDGLFTVAMGKPLEDLKLLHIDEPVWGKEYEADGKLLKLYTLFQSTIHTVVFVDRIDTDMMNTIGEQICNDAMYKEKTNVNFVHVIDETTIEMQTYERGCGLTLACGTGACAAAVCSKRLGYVSSVVNILLPVGQLTIEVKDDEEVYLTGPAKCIAKGETDYEAD